MLRRIRAFWGRETRSLDTGYSSWLQGIAAGTGSPGNAAETAAAMSCCAIWSGALAASAVDGDVHDAVDAELLSRIGWRLVSRGQYIARIVIDGGEVRLIEPSDFEVSGGPLPSSWRWRLVETGPDAEHTVRDVVDAGVVRIPWATVPAAPWSGVSPLSSSTAAALANIEKRLQEEAGSLSALVLPTPPATARADGQAVDPGAKLGADLAEAKGRPVLVETMAAGHGDGRAAAPLGDYRQRRIGFDPPSAIDPLRQHVEESVYAACGIPPALGVSEVASGQGMREAYRRFVVLSVAPTLARVQLELRLKLDSPALALSADPLRGEDYAGRARAVAQLAAAGMGIGEALAASGFEEG